MRFSSFIYLVGQGLHNLRANRLMTFASMGVLTVCMLLIGAASLLGINIDHMVEYIGNQNLTVVYMGGTGESEVATDEQIAAADAAIRSTPHVVSVTYMSPEDVLATYSDMLKDYTNLQQVFANDNPFTPNYRVTVDDPDNIKEVSAQLMQIDGVYSVKAPLAMADTFTSLQKVINYACYGLVAVLAIVSIVVINNTIKITVFNRRKEIGIMKLVGATNGFIRFPFFVEHRLRRVLCTLPLVCRESVQPFADVRRHACPAGKRLVLHRRRLCAAGLRALRPRHRHQHPQASECITGDKGNV